MLVIFGYYEEKFFPAVW